MHTDELDRYIDIVKRKQQRPSYKDRWRKWVDTQFKVQSGRKSIYLWRSRPFEEVMYMYFPRFAFILGSSYLIHLIMLR